MPYIALPSNSKMINKTAESRMSKARTSITYSKNLYLDNRNAYLTRLSGYKPGVAIDALKEDIRLKVRDSKGLGVDIKLIEEFLSKTKE